MRKFTKKFMVLAVAALALAVVALPAQAAKPSPCVPHAVSYQVSGTLTVAGSLTAGSSKGTYNGSLTVKVTRTNSGAEADKGLTKTYTLTNVRVSFGHGVSKTAPAAGSRVNVKGTITREPTSCTGFTPTLTVKKVELLAAKKK